MLLISIDFQNVIFEIITINVTKIVLIQVLFLPLLLNKQNKIENTEYHGASTLFKSQLYSKLGSLIFLLFGSWNLELYLYVWVNQQFF